MCDDCEVEGMCDCEYEKIKNWDFRDFRGLINKIKYLWEYEDYFILNETEEMLFLELHTGGWSDHECIISALEENFLFWSMFWVRSERGGHYWFEIKKNAPIFGSKKEQK